MAVSKTYPADAIREAYEAGVTVFGENRVQEFAGKRDAIANLRIEWHLIGHLQSNKSWPAAELFDAVDSLDSLKLARRLNEAARELGKTIDVLVEVNVGGEDAKSGFAISEAESFGGEFAELVRRAPELEALHIRGLMCIPPAGESEGSRVHFRRVRELRDAIARRKLPRIEMDELSMGMSGDFEVAIEEGATCVRVGTGIFGARN